MYPSKEQIVQKYHSVVQDSVRENLNKFNFKIEFIEPTWVITEYSGGFSGRVQKRNLVELEENSPFGILSVDKDKKKQCSRIHVWSDGYCDGYNLFLINVPNGLFKQIT